ncbi:hypothetical protein [Microbacterium sp. 5K110]|uniref:hypothetical protein n=1 Tax=unclassified Microbacterium TaxID=2609290 RepID=UPI0010FE9A4C|nr:hypothetical protein [Microbacterium sp. 5K110]TLF29210.1 hypothetical protein FE256_13110 [Microbacterium sp. 5K110]
MTPDRHVDPTKVTNQDAVRRPKPLVWIAASGVLALIAVVLFALSVPIVAAWAWIGIAVQVGIFAAIAVNGLTGRRGPAQGYVFAVLMCVQAAVALLVIVVIAVAAWAPLR